MDLFINVLTQKGILKSSYTRFDKNPSRVTTLEPRPSSEAVLFLGSLEPALGRHISSMALLGRMA